jgi:hypothetical protein
MFSLSSVEFRQSSIAGRGVFARRPFRRGDLIVGFAPRQTKVDARSPEALAAADGKLTLLSDDGRVIVPDTSVPGGWLCNHSCDPNAAIFSSGQGRVECTRPIAAGDEVTVFYGWVSHNEPRRDPCLCGAPRCRGFINFDLGDDDARDVQVREDRSVAVGGALQARLAEYSEFLRSIGQEQVNEVIATTLARLALRKPGSVICAY